MQKKHLLEALIALASLALLVFVGYVVLRPGAVEAPRMSSNQAAPEEKDSYIERGQYFEITAHFATTTPLKASAGDRTNAAAVALMQRFVIDTVTQFKTNGNFDHLSAEDITMLGLDQGRKESLQISYLSSASPHTVSYIFNIYEDTLGAHGNTSFKTFTFDTRTGALLSLGDLFIPKAGYLSTLSALSRTKLPGVIGKDLADKAMIEAGTAPEEANFSTFFLDEGSLVLMFPPYAVAAYAAGTQTLPLPRASLKSLLKPDYQ